MWLVGVDRPALQLRLVLAGRERKVGLAHEGLAEILEAVILQMSVSAWLCTGSCEYWSGFEEKLTLVHRANDLGLVVVVRVGAEAKLVLRVEVSVTLWSHMMADTYYTVQGMEDIEPRRPVS